MREIDRPFDFLDNIIGREALIKFKDGKELIGEIITFDIHMNIIIAVNGKDIFLKGDGIFSIEENKKEKKK